MVPRIPAMQRSVVKDIEIKVLLKQALTHQIDRVRSSGDAILNCSEINRVRCFCY